MERLMSMVDYVIYTYDQTEDSLDSEQKMFDYANFLKQPISIEMFVPCDLEGNVLEQPGLMPSYERLQYLEAKERCLFDGFEVSVGKEAIISDENTIRIHEDNTFSLNGKQVFVIEDLVKYNIKLTPTALKQIL